MAMETMVVVERGSDVVIQRSSYKIFLTGHLPKLHSLPHKAVA